LSEKQRTAISPFDLSLEISRETRVGIPVSEIEAGRCYLTALGQVRRVLKFGNGKVTDESRGKKATSGSWGEQNTVVDGRFAQDVEREVPCDFSI
jgi:hypothetical protein